MPAARMSFSMLYLLFLGLLPLLFSGLTLFYIYQYQAQLQSLSNGQWLLLFLCSSITMAFALTPTTLIALCSGYFLGLPAIWFAAPSYLLASIIGYCCARLVDGGSLLRAVSRRKKANRLLQNIRHQSFGIVVLSRLSPVLPFALMNFVLAALNVPFRTFVWAGLIGMLPRTVLFIWVGSQAKELSAALQQPDENNLIRWVVVALVIGTVLGMTYLAGRAMKKG